MNIVVVGHVDHGKSTVVGRLLVDTNSLPEGKLEQVKANCERNSKPFEYAFLLDTLKDEQSQGITIDSTRIFFKTNKRPYTIIDAPGHIEFLKNMITGAARAEAALLVIDAKEGVQENSRRHGYLLSMLGVRQVAVVVNKMDLLGRSQPGFEKIRDEYDAFLKKINVTATTFIPISGFFGDNVVTRSKEMPWYTGPTIVEALDNFSSQDMTAKLPFRMPVQEVYKFTKGGDDRRIVAGTIEYGEVKVGDQVVFYPSGKKSVVKTIEAFNRPVQTQAAAGSATGFTLTEQIYIGRGELASIVGQTKPHTTTRIAASLFWLGPEPMMKKRSYFLKLGTQKVEARLESVSRLMNTSSLDVVEGVEEIQKNSVAECVLKLERAIAVDLASEFITTGRFVIVDKYDTAGGGLVREALSDQQSWVREKVLLRNYKWEQSMISPEERSERYNQRATLILISSSKTVDRKLIGKKLEAALFGAGRTVYYLGMGNALYGIGGDIHGKDNTFQENLRRLSELANVLLDAGLILIVTASDLTQDDLELIKVAVDPDRIETVWVGPTVTTDLRVDLHLSADQDEMAVAEIKRRLQEKGIVFKPG